MKDLSTKQKEVISRS